MVKKLLKLACAGLTALAILCFFCAVYNRTPMYRPSTLGNTDFVWPGGAAWSQMIEGISHGRFDAWGFNNPAVREDPDILLLGSSHMEGTYVNQDRLLTVQLEKLLEGRATAYNMGISGCHLPQTLQSLPKTLEVYENPPGLILIESHDLYLSQEQVSSILEGTIPSIFTPKPGWLRPILSLPYLRLMAQQKNLGLLNLLNPPRKPAPAEVYEEDRTLLPPDAAEGGVYDPIFQQLQALQQQYGVTFLIFYQPTEELQKDGSVIFPQDPRVLVFEQKCRDYGIAFLNMTESFETMYTRDHRLPHGFITGRIGTGHLNADGHEAIARAVFDWICQQEGK